MKKITKALALMLALICALTALVACTARNNDDNNDTTSAVEYYINYKGVKVELDKSAANVISSLGTPKKVEELSSCGPFGSQVKYYYDDIILFTLKSDNGETIDQISFTNDIPETKKGICIGSTSDEVITAYGKATEQTNSLIIYAKKCEGYSLYLKFGVENGEIDKIEFIRLYDVED